MRSCHVVTVVRVNVPQRRSWTVVSSHDEEFRISISTAPTRRPPFTCSYVPPFPVKTESCQRHPGISKGDKTLKSFFFLSCVYSNRSGKYSYSCRGAPIFLKTKKGKETNEKRRPVQCNERQKQKIERVWKNKKAKKEKREIQPVLYYASSGSGFVARSTGGLWIRRE